MINGKIALFSMKYVSKNALFGMYLSKTYQKLDIKKGSRNSPRIKLTNMNKQI